MEAKLSEMELLEVLNTYSLSESASEKGYKQGAP
jgi:hypothetical protein